MLACGLYVPNEPQTVCTHNLNKAGAVCGHD